MYTSPVAGSQITPAVPPGQSCFLPAASIFLTTGSRTVSEMLTQRVSVFSWAKLCPVRTSERRAVERKRRDMVGGSERREEMIEVFAIITSPQSDCATTKKARRKHFGFLPGWKKQ